MASQRFEQVSEMVCLESKITSVGKSVRVIKTTHSVTMVHFSFQKRGILNIKKKLIKTHVRSITANGWETWVTQMKNKIKY